VIDRAVLTEFFVKLSSGRVIEIEEQVRFFDRFEIVYFDQDNFSAFARVLQQYRQHDKLVGFTAIDKEISRRHAELARVLVHDVYRGFEREPLIINAMDRYGAESGRGRPDITAALEYVIYLASLCHATGSGLLLWRARAHLVRALAKLLQLNLDSADDGPSVSRTTLKDFPYASENGTVSTFDLVTYQVEENQGIRASRRDGGSERLGEIDVFVSYARSDGEFVANLVKALEDQSFAIWWDGEISPGRRFAASIQRALDDAKTVLVIWSASSIRSDWVKDEAGVGKDRDKLVAIAIDDVRPPLGFRQLQTLDLRRADDWRQSAAFEALTSELRRRCERQ
jgi:hypothetical protein